MNYQIDIEITDTSLEELGCNPKSTYTNLFFNGKLLAGFWVDPDEEFIKFYLQNVTAGAFICKNTAENLDLLTKIHNENNH